MQCYRTQRELETVLEIALTICCFKTPFFFLLQFRLSGFFMHSMASVMGRCCLLYSLISWQEEHGRNMQVYSFWKQCKPIHH